MYNRKMRGNLPHRQSTRLPEYDYSQPGMYFVIICVREKVCVLGKIINGEMQLSAVGQLIKSGFEVIQEHFPDVGVDKFVVMPNHFHLIIEIREGRGEVTSPAPLDARKSGGETPPLRQPALGNIIVYYKYQTTKKINQLRQTPGVPLWQRNFYEHIIRDDEDLYNIRRYIEGNPRIWDEDEENPVNKGAPKCPRYKSMS